jgi:hypothetical protein
MTENFIQLPVDGKGKKTRTLLKTISGEDVHQQITTIADSDGTLVNLNNLLGFNIPPYDYIELTYVTAGHGIGEVETVTYKKGGSSGTTVATLTLTYNASNEISSIAKT